MEALFFIGELMDGHTGDSPGHRPERMPVEKAAADVCFHPRRARAIRHSSIMLSFKHKDGRFSCRAVGVITDRGRLLIHREEGDDFWTLPGGRPEFGEPANLALERELWEELGVRAEAGRLIWVVENFFTYRDEARHEMAFYFHVSLPEASPLRDYDEPFAGEDSGVPLIFEWHEIASLEAIKVRPSFIPKALARLPQHTEYVVHSDERN